MPILTPEEWMLRCLMRYFGISSRAEVFVIAHQKQNMPEGAEAARSDYRRYEETGHLPPYVRAWFYETFPWNKEAGLEPEFRLLAAE